MNQRRERGSQQAQLETSSIVSSFRKRLSAVTCRLEVRFDFKVGGFLTPRLGIQCPYSGCRRDSSAMAYRLLVLQDRQCRKFHRASH